MIPEFFVKTTELYVKTTDTIWIVHLPERTKTGLTTAMDQTVWAVHCCNSLFVVTFQTVSLWPGMTDEEQFAPNEDV